MDAALYSVKEAGAADAAARLGGVALNSLRGAAKALFSNHPLPTYQARVRTTPGVVENLVSRMRGAPAYQGPNVYSRAARPGYGTGFVNRAKTTGHAVGDFLREGVFGSPLTVSKELREGGLGQYYKNFFAPGNSRSAMLLQGAFPAMSVYHAMNSAPEHRGEETGRALADAALLPLTARLGVPGQLLLRHPAMDLAGRVGRLFDPKQPPTAPPPDVP